MSGAPDRLLCLPVEGIGEVVEGDDLAALLVSAAARPHGLEDGDVLVVTSKVVSKAEGRTRSTKREEALAGETDRTLARRGGTSIVRTSHGLVLAAAGIDASNVDPGTVVLLPLDPDGSARALREAVARLTGRNVAVLVTDTAGRAWRTGQTDIAIGAAGLEVLEDHAGRTDPYGNELAVTAPAVADELASAADLVKRKLARRPAAVVRGLPGLVLPPGVHGPGAAALVRPETQDMFGLGAREAVLGALHAVDRRGFGAPCSAVELVAQLSAVVAGTELRVEGDEVVVVRVRGTDWEQGAADARLRAAAFALGWHPFAEGRGRGAERAMLRFGQGTP